MSRQAIPLVPGVLGQGLVPAKVACLHARHVSISMQNPMLWFIHGKRL